MHDIRLIRDNPAAFDKGLDNRGLAPLSGALIALDDARKAAISAAQEAQERRNALSKEIGAAKKAKDEARAQELMAEVARLKETAPALETAEKEASEKLRAELAGIPNTPGPEVPVGADETGNVVRSEWGKPVALANPKQHFELAEAWKVANGTAMDFDVAAKLSGSRFVVLRGQLARMERALGQFMLDLHTNEHGYTEVSPPLLVQDDVMFGTAQLPKFREDQFDVVGEFHRLSREYEASRNTSEELSYTIQKLNELSSKFGSIIFDTKSKGTDISWSSELFAEFANYFEEMSKRQKIFSGKFGKIRDEFIDMARRGGGRYWLIPTAEVPLTNLVRESILSEEELPLRFTALTPCFRAEAGAAGRDTRGMLRQHQFTKCELVSITAPEKSAEEHERMLACAEAVLRKLDLPYRVMTLCTGDMGFASAKTYDIEVWVPGQGTFREISSCSVCGDFQARRMEARYRPKEGKGPRYVHTLNGSGVAVGRALIAVLENYQQPDGSVAVPDALRPYMGGLEKIGG